MDLFDNFINQGVCVCVCVCVSPSVMSNYATPWTIAVQAPLSMEFSRQEYWSELPFPSPGDFVTQESNPGLLHCRGVLYHLSRQGSSSQGLSIIKLYSALVYSQLGLPRWC